MLKKYRSLRLVFASIMLFAITVVGLAANFGNVEFFNAFTVQAEEPSATETQIETPSQPMLTIGVCDTAGPIEIESTGGTTAPTAYATLKDGFDAINAGTHTGAVKVEVFGNTTETATASLDASGVDGFLYQRSYSTFRRRKNCRRFTFRTSRRNCQVKRCG